MHRIKYTAVLKDKDGQYTTELDATDIIILPSGGLVLVNTTNNNEIVLASHSWCRLEYQDTNHDHPAPETMSRLDIDGDETFLVNSYELSGPSGTVFAKAVTKDDEGLDRLYTAIYVNGNSYNTIMYFK